MNFNAFLLISCATISNILADDRNYYAIDTNDKFALNNDVDDLQIVQMEDKVTVQLFYESLCPGCRQFDTTAFKQTFIALGQYATFLTYPYGNAKTEIVDDDYVFTCQHGPTECYGNKLHACALHLLNNKTLAVLYNSCMMEEDREGHGSDDVAADECGEIMNIPSESIKKCATSKLGSDLLYAIGEVSKKVAFKQVPYVLINGKSFDISDDLMRKVCSVFKNPPPPCNDVVGNDFISF